MPRRRRAKDPKSLNRKWRPEHKVLPGAKRFAKDHPEIELEFHKLRTDFNPYLVGGDGKQKVWWFSVLNTKTGASERFYLSTEAATQPPRDVVFQALINETLTIIYCDDVQGFASEVGLPYLDNQERWHAAFLYRAATKNAERLLEILGNDLFAEFVRK